MSSKHKDRFFHTGIPVLITVRCILRHELLKSPVYRRLLNQLIAKWIARCQVDVLAAAYLDNHFHVIAIQHRNNHDPERIKGISPFMRNVKSALSHGFRTLAMSGCKFEGTFHSRNLWTLEQLVDRLAYVIGQAERHGISRRQVHTSHRVFQHAKPDGIVSLIPSVFPDAASLEERTKLLGQMLDEIIREACKRARKSPRLQAKIAAQQAINQQRRARRYTPEHEHFRAATRSALRARGLRGSTPTDELEYAAAEKLDASAHRAAQVRLGRPGLPKGLRIIHERDSWGRVYSTCVCYRNSRVFIYWSRRVG